MPIKHFHFPNPPMKLQKKSSATKPTILCTSIKTPSHAATPNHHCLQPQPLAEPNCHSKSLSLQNRSVIDSDQTKQTFRWIQNPQQILWPRKRNRIIPIPPPKPEKENMENIKWLDYADNMFHLQKGMYKNPTEYDILLVSSDGATFRAHRIFLSGSSDFFHMLLKDVPNSEIATIYIPDAKSDLIEPLLAFIYTGEVFVSPMHLTSFLEMCSFLQIKGYIMSGSTVNGLNIDMRHAKSSPAPAKSDDGGRLTPSEADKADESSYMIVEDYEVKEYVTSDDEIAVEYLEADSETVEDNSNMAYEVTGLEVEAQDLEDLEDIDHTDTEKPLKRSLAKKFGTRSNNNEIERALSEISTGKTIHQLSREYKVPRSTLYHKFRSSDNLKKNYRSERKAALRQSVASVMEDGISLKRAADKFSVPKTAIWRELRKTEEYQVPSKDVSAARLQAQEEIIAGKSLTSISIKYGIPLTTVHRDKKRLSQEGKLPECFKIKDRTENSGILTVFQTTLNANVSKKS